MKGLGDNRLAFVADEARQALGRVLQGEESAIGGWLAYGFALIEGRDLNKSDSEFGKWLDDNSLRQVVGPDGFAREINDHERAAAMWAAANPVQFDEARQRGNPRSIRGIHAKWKEIEAEREAEARQFAEKQDRATATAETVSSPAPKEAVSEVIEDEAAPDPYGYADLTETALLDLATGLRADLDDEKTKRKQAEAERDRFKAANKELTESSDQGRTIGKLQRRIDSITYARDEAMKATKREEYKRKLAEKRIAELERLQPQER